MVLQLIASVLQLIVKAYTPYIVRVINTKGDMVRDPRIVS